MKKIIIILFVISSLFLLSNSNEIIIPKESIRFRVIANSNSLEDQNKKKLITNELLTSIIPNANNDTLLTYENKIENIIPKIKEKLDIYNIEYNINYGNNYFPSKTYKGIKYPSGYYKSLVITLGKGIGNNFWCVLYPPLCLIDDENTDEIQYKSIVLDTINKYINK